MNTKVIMPQLGESVYEGTLTKWLKKTGDPVVKDEPLFEVSTDKVDSEIPAPASGILDEILVDEGTTIKIDTVVAVIRESAGDGDAGGEEPGEETAREPAAETGTEAGGEAGKIVEEGAEAAGGKAKEDSAAPSIRPQSLLASPLVRKIARENGVDLADVSGTGLEGRITKDDLEKHLSRVGAARPAAPGPAGGGGGAAAAPAGGRGGRRAGGAGRGGRGGWRRRRAGERAGGERRRRCRNGSHDPDAPGDRGADGREQEDFGSCQYDV
jgi:2-oxoglutarate dehydrogenase E2 component (dihydrolipoamide succinyltransferase)